MNPIITKAYLSQLEKYFWSLTANELKIYTALWLLSENAIRLNISSYELAEKLEYNWKLVENNLTALKQQGLIDCRLCSNPHVLMEINIPKGCPQNLPQKSNNPFKKIIEFFVNVIFNKIKNKRLNVNEPRKNCGKPNHKLPKWIRSDSNKLACEIAGKLNDKANVQVYEHYAKLFPKKFLIRALNEILNSPNYMQIENKSRLFSYLVRKAFRDNGQKNE